MCKNRDFLSVFTAFQHVSAQRNKTDNALKSITWYIGWSNFKSLASTSFATLAMSNFNILANQGMEALHNGKIVVQTMFDQRSEDNAQWLMW